MRRDPLVTPAHCDDQGVLRLEMHTDQHRALCQARFGGTDVEIEVRLRQTKRSARANAAFHAGAYEFGRAQGLSGPALETFVEDFKDDLLALCFGYVVRQDQFSGEVTRRLVKPHTSALDVEDFGVLFETAVMMAARAGHVWTLPEEWKAKRSGTTPRRVSR